MTLLVHAVRSFTSLRPNVVSSPIAGTPERTANADLKAATAAGAPKAERCAEGQEPDPASGAVVVPISLSTTFTQESVGVHQGYEYSRSGNPTHTAYETSFASGLAAEDNILRLLSPGDRVLLGNDAYGGTYRLIAKVHAPAGLTWAAVDLLDIDRLRADWPADTKMVWLETPTNPFLVLRGMKTLAVRIDRHCLNTRAIVDMLGNHRAIERVLYPGHPDHHRSYVPTRGPAGCFRFRQPSEQYFTSSQFLAQALRHAIGRPQTAHNFSGSAFAALRGWLRGVVICFFTS
jgi:cystathionine beta-lyase/cystathionine gamma-synthase